MEAALVALIGALIGHFLTAHNKAADRRVALLKALADFLESIASCLDEMHKELSSYNVPTAAGNRLITLILNYEVVVESARADERTRLALAAAFHKVKRCLVEGRAEDEILRGHILRESEKRRMDLLAELLRTAAKLRGEAASIRATAA